MIRRDSVENTNPRILPGSQQHAAHDGTVHGSDGTTEIDSNGLSRGTLRSATVYSGQDQHSDNVELLSQLKDHGLLWIEDINCLYCSRCKYCLQRKIENDGTYDSGTNSEDSSNIRQSTCKAILRHLRDKHKKKVEVLKSLMELLTCSNHILVTQLASATLSSLMNGDDGIDRIRCSEENLPLPIPILDTAEGFMCCLCGFCSINHKTMRSHHGRNHKADSAALVTNTVSRLLQQVFAGSDKKYFPVRRQTVLPAPASATSNDNDEGTGTTTSRDDHTFENWYTEATSNITNEEQSYVEGANNSSNFYAVSGFNNYLVDIGAEGVKGIQILVSKDDEDHEHDDIHDAIAMVDVVVASFGEAIQQAIRTSASNIQILQMLVENDEYHERHHKKKHFNSLQEASTVQAYCKYFSKFVVMLLRLGHRTDTASVKMKKGGSTNLWNEVESLESTLRAMVALETSVLTSDAVSALRQLMVSFLQKVYHPCTPRGEDLFYIFLVATHLKEAGEWKDISDITHNVAIIQYFCRGAILLHCIQDYLQWEAEHTVAESLDPAYNLLHPITRADKRYQVRPFSTLLQMMKLATTYADTTNFPVSTWVAGSSHMSQLVNGKLGDLRSIRSKLHDLLAAVECDLEECFQGFTPSVTLSTAIEDDLRCKMMFYSFLSDNSNNLQHVTKECIQYLTVKFYRGDISTSFTATNQRNWNMNVMRNWWKRCDAVMVNVLVLIFLSSGMPPRMTEFTRLTIRNLVASKRNLFVLQGRMVMLSTYNKTDSVTAIDKPIARFLHPRVGTLLFKIVSFIRPAQAAFSSVYLNLESRSDIDIVRQQMLNYLCVFEGKQITPPVMRVKFQSVMSHSLDCRWSNADWRHGIIQWARVFLSPNVEKRYAAKLELQKVRSSQVGNSPRLELFRYGIESCSFEELDSTALETFMDYSWDFQLTLLLLTVPVDPSSSTAAHPLATVTTQVTNVSLDSVSTGIVERIEVLLRQHHCHDKIIDAFKNEVLGPLHLLIRKDKYQDAAHAIVNVTKNVKTENTDAMEMLRVMQGCPSIPFKTFRSVGQRQAAHSCWRNANDILAILPTGSGKTAVFAIAAVLEGLCKTTLVIIPTVALGDDMQHQLSHTYGLSCCQWTKMSLYERESPRQSCQIVLMTVECVGQKSAQSYISQLFTTNRLRRIVIDEAHLMLYWCSFRPKYKSLRYLRTFDVPIVMLTATLSPLEESHLLIEYGVQWPQVIRESTNRKNLRYVKVAVNTNDATIQRIRDAETGPSVLDVCSRATAFFTIKLIVERLELLQQTGPTHCVIVYFSTVKSLEAFFDILTISAASTAFYDYFEAYGVAKRDSIAAVKSLVLKWSSVFGVYHSQLDSTAAHSTLESFRGNQIRVLLATSAFGLGINKPNVILCICYGPPWGLNSLIQQFGRCARDPILVGDCYCIYDNETASDFFTMVDMSQSSASDAIAALNQRDFEHLKSFLNDTTQCLRGMISEYADGSVGCCFDSTDNVWCSFCSPLSVNREEIRTGPIAIVASLAPILSELRAIDSRQENLEEEQMALECLRAVNSLKQQCLPCFFIEKVFKRHADGKCSYNSKGHRYYGKCFHCRLAPHKPKDCRLRLRDMFPILGLDRPFCYVCSFAKKHGNVAFHPSDSAGNVTFGKDRCLARDIVYELIWLGLEDAEMRARIYTEFHKECPDLQLTFNAERMWKAMVPWMFKETLSFLNMSILFLYIYNCLNQ